MMYERLVLMHELLSDTGQHLPALRHEREPLAPVRSATRSSASRCFRNEISWKRSTAQERSGSVRAVHDRILYYTKSDERTFNPVRSAEGGVRSRRTTAPDETRPPLSPGLDLLGPRWPWHRSTNSTEYERNWRFTEEKMHVLEAEGRIMVRDGANAVPDLSATSTSRKVRGPGCLGRSLSAQSRWRESGLATPTQKPESLLERIINASSATPAISSLTASRAAGRRRSLPERLGRRWIACDLGRFAIHTTRKRLLNVPDCQPFEIKNLGAYERQRWQVDHRATVRSAPTSTRSLPSIAPSPWRALPISTAARRTGWSMSGPPMLR